MKARKSGPRELISGSLARLVAVIILLISPKFGGEKLLYLVGGVMMIMVLIDMLISYNCAYEKRGTAWLLFSIIFIPLTIISPWIQYVINYSEFFSQSGVDILKVIAGELFFGVLWSWYWFNCFRLRKVNLSLKRAEGF